MQMTLYHMTGLKLKLLFVQLVYTFSTETQIKFVFGDICVVCTFGLFY